MSGLWMQDWVGLKTFTEGDRLIWNWELSEEYYPHWSDLVQQWSDDGVKPLIYINPYIANLTNSSGTMRQN